jgi:hypothetical protein
MTIVFMDNEHTARCGFGDTKAGPGGENRNPKTEIRNPKSEVRNKSKIMEMQKWEKRGRKFATNRETGGAINLCRAIVEILREL